MALLHLDSLPPRTTKGTLVRLLTQVGQVDQSRIGRIEVRGRAASIEVPDRWANRLSKALDGTSVGHQLIRAWHELPDDGSGDDHFSRLARLLEVEAEAEDAEAQRELRDLTPQEAEQSGHSLVDLTVQDQTAGLGGRCVVTLGKASQTALPWSRIGIGSPVRLSAQGDSPFSCRGVVSHRGGSAIEVALERPLEPDIAAVRLRIDRCSDEVAVRRQKLALQRAKSAHGDRLTALRRVLLGEQRAGQRETEADWENESLNASQREAVETAFAAEDVAIIHGPPGTGKTTTVVELIRREVRAGSKVLACAPSNTAVDNVFEKLIAAGEAAIRLGHPARVAPELRQHTLDLLVENHGDNKLVRKLTRDAYALLERANRFTRAKPAPGAKRELREEAKQMLEDARRIEAQVIQQLIDSADVLCATLTGVDSDLLGQRQFDLAVIDEACQATEPCCWIPLLRSQRLVLAGDHCQLPPTVISQDAQREGLAISMLERLMDSELSDFARQLKVQYRMHEAIMEFSSAEFYEASLVADTSVATHRLADLDDVDETELTNEPLLFVDTAGAGYDDQLESRGRSYLNPSEAELIKKKVGELLDAGLSDRQIAVIAPYAAQVRHIREALAGWNVETDTVDGFQGREKEAVLISLVRSNATGEIGFLADTRRMNVALTRARRKLVIVGDSATIANHEFYARMLEYMESRGAYRSVWEEL